MLAGHLEASKRQHLEEDFGRRRVFLYIVRQHVFLMTAVCRAAQAGNILMFNITSTVARAQWGRPSRDPDTAAPWTPTVSVRKSRVGAHGALGPEAELGLTSKSQLEIRPEFCVTARVPKINMSFGTRYLGSFWEQDLWMDARQ